MKRISELVSKSWRAVLTAVFVMLIFAVPASKGVLNKLFSVHASGGGYGNDHGNNHSNSNDNSHNSHSSNSSGQSSHGSPHSNPTASPVNQGDSCSTGRRHSDSHHGHRGHRHYRPNGR